MAWSTVDAVKLLCSEGYSVSPGYVAWVLREGHIAAPNERIGMAYAWTDADVARLRSFLRRRDHGLQKPSSRARSLPASFCEQWPKLSFSAKANA